MSEPLPTRAVEGDEQAFRELTEPYRRELHPHCYRLLGSVADAEDVLQETMLAAWRGLARFEGRATVRAWLYRIATNRCLNALRDARRRPPPPVPPFEPPAPTRYGDVTWLQPYPDALLEHIADGSPGPEARYQAKEAVELAFIAGLQRLPPRQRAALVLRDVLGFGTAEVAAMLGGSQASVKGAVARARAVIGAHRPAATDQLAPHARSARERELSRRFAEAFQAGDIDGIIALLTHDAWLTMPPAPHEYQGAAAIASFLRASAAWRAGRRIHLLPTRANTQPAFGCYLDDAAAPVAHAAGMVVLTHDGDRVTAITRFLDSDPLRVFGLPSVLTGTGRAW